MKIAVKFADKENLEKIVNEIKLDDIKWITQNGDEYTIIYKVYEKQKIQVVDKSLQNKKKIRGEKYGK